MFPGQFPSFFGIPHFDGSDYVIEILYVLLKDLLVLGKITFIIGINVFINRFQNGDKEEVPGNFGQ